MIFYLTKETAERYKAPMQETNEILEKESGDRLLEFGIAIIDTTQWILIK